MTLMTEFLDLGDFRARGLICFKIVCLNCISSLYFQVEAKYFALEWLGTPGAVTMSSLSRELVFLILQFLDEEKFKETVHK